MEVRDGEILIKVVNRDNARARGVFYYYFPALDVCLFLFLLDMQQARLLPRPFSSRRGESNCEA